MKIPYGKNKDYVLQAIQAITKGDPTRSFTPAEVVEEIGRAGYDIPLATATFHIIAASPNHRNWADFHGHRNKYWWISGNRFRLLNPETDKV